MPSKMPTPSPSSFTTGMRPAPPLIMSSSTSARLADGSTVSTVERTIPRTLSDPRPALAARTRSFNLRDPRNFILAVDRFSFFLLSSPTSPSSSSSSSSPAASTTGALFNSFALNTSRASSTVESASMQINFEAGTMKELATSCSGIWDDTASRAAERASSAVRAPDDARLRRRRSMPTLSPVRAAASSFFPPSASPASASASASLASASSASSAAI
mmetsp:Transcript_30562/g.91318  ORF Transcript_30562/g.91318 Transcript_30562/m.91318 type:complete len:217 (+) Transcript_30562:357-1007(+)